MVDTGKEALLAEHLRHALAFLARAAVDDGGRRRFQKLQVGDERVLAAGRLGTHADEEVVPEEGRLERGGRCAKLEVARDVAAHFRGRRRRQRRHWHAGHGAAERANLPVVWPAWPHSLALTTTGTYHQQPTHFLKPTASGSTVVPSYLSSVRACIRNSIRARRKRRSERLDDGLQESKLDSCKEGKGSWHCDRATMAWTENGHIRPRMAAAGRWHCGRAYRGDDGECGGTPEVMAPGGEAMRFIDNDACQPAPVPRLQQ